MRGYIMLLSAMLVVFGCGAHDRPAGPDAPAFELGEGHNRFLGLMMDWTLENGGSTAGSFAKATEILTTEFGMDRAEAREQLWGAARRLREMNKSGIYRGAGTDADSLCDWFVARQYVAAGDEAETRLFLRDLLADKSKAMDLAPVAQRWRLAAASPGIRGATEILEASSRFWADKRWCQNGPCTRGDQVVADALGGLIGMALGPWGVFIGGSVASYMAAEYMTVNPDGSPYDPDWAGPPRPLPWKAAGMAIGFPPKHASSWGYVICIPVCGLVYWRAKKRYALSDLWPLGLVMLVAPICVFVIGAIARDYYGPPWWGSGLSIVVGAAMMLRTARRRRTPASPGRIGGS